MAYQFRPGEIAPESGIYRVTHETRHVAPEREVTMIKGRCFPACGYCRNIGFELVHQARHVSEIPHLHEVGAAAPV